MALGCLAGSEGGPAAVPDLHLDVGVALLAMGQHSRARSFLGGLMVGDGTLACACLFLAGRVASSGTHVCALAWSMAPGLYRCGRSP